MLDIKKKLPKGSQVGQAKEGKVSIMKEKTFYEALLNHCEKVAQYDGVNKEKKEDWIFGALHFACCEGFISPEQYEVLTKKHELF